MKVCEYDNVSCPYCRESERLNEMGPVDIDVLMTGLLGKKVKPGRVSRRVHMVTCVCGGTFLITCED